eukprot:364197-Chlamydomonas_euryale.AAC.58
MWDVECAWHWQRAEGLDCCGRPCPALTVAGGPAAAAHPAYAPLSTASRCRAGEQVSAHQHQHACAAASIVCRPCASGVGRPHSPSLHQHHAGQRQSVRLCTFHAGQQRSGTGRRGCRQRRCRQRQRVRSAVSAGERNVVWEGH